MSTYKCFRHRNIIKLACCEPKMKRCDDGETEPTENHLGMGYLHQASWGDDGETEPTENHLGNGISASGIMKKLTNGHHFINMHHMENFQITDPPKVWVSGFLSVHRNRILVSAIKKKSKNVHHFVTMHYTEKCQITDSPKVWVSSFLSVNRNRILTSAIMKKSKIWPPFCKYVSYGKISNYQPSQNFGLWFSGNGILVSAIMKK